MKTLVVLGFMLCCALFFYAQWASNETDRRLAKIQKDKSNGKGNE